jgi:hypothetical protein
LTLEQELLASWASLVLHISDPQQGDHFVFGTIGQLEQFPIPETADSHKITFAADLLNRLDFEAYSEPPAITKL